MAETDEIGNLFDEANQPPEQVEGGPLPAGTESLPPGVADFDADALFAQMMAEAQQFAGTDEEELRVVHGYRQVPRVVRSTPEQRATMTPGQLASAMRAEFDAGPAFELEPQEAPIDEIARNIWYMPPSDLYDLQQRLFAAGFYGRMDFDDIGWQTPGPDTYVAFTDFLRHAALWTDRTGEKPLWGDVLDEMVGAHGGLDEALRQRQPTTVVTQTDPAALREVLNRTGTAVLGRKPSTSQQRAFVAMIHQMQASQQTVAQQASRQTGGGTVTTTAPDVGARAVEFVREANPKLAQAHDAVRVYGDFLNMIGARIGARR